MSGYINASKTEWMCAAIIDYLIAVTISSIYLCFSYFSRKFCVNVDKQFIEIVVYAFATLYLLTKDLMLGGRSVGKRAVGIDAYSGREPLNKWLSLVRNLPLALVFFTSSVLRADYFDLFFFYVVFEYACFWAMGKSAGDLLCSCRLISVGDNEWVESLDIPRRTVYLGIIAVLFWFVKIAPSISPNMSSVLVCDPFILVFANQVMSFLLLTPIYAIILNKLVKPKALCWVCIALCAMAQLFSILGTLRFLLEQC